MAHRICGVEVNEGSIKEIQLCPQFSASEDISEGVLKSASRDMLRLGLGEADKDSCESNGLYGNAGESVSRTMQGLNRPSFQPSRRPNDGPRFECGRSESSISIAILALAAIQVTFWEHQKQCLLIFYPKIRRIPSISV